MRNPDSWKECKKFGSDKIELYTLDNFLTYEECDKIIEITKRNLMEPKTTWGKLFNSKGCLHFTSKMLEQNDFKDFYAPTDCIFMPDGTNNKITFKRGRRVTEPGMLCIPPKDIPSYKTWTYEQPKSSPIEIFNRVNSKSQVRRN